MVNEDASPAAEILSQAVTYAGPSFAYLTPPNSLTVLRIPGGNSLAVQ